MEIGGPVVSLLKNIKVITSNRGFGGEDKLRTYLTYHGRYGTPKRVIPDGNR